MKKAIFDIEWARVCIPCAYHMEDIYLVQRRGGARPANCERCGKKTMTLRIQYTMKGAELIRRGYAEPPEWMKEEHEQKNLSRGT